MIRVDVPKDLEARLEQALRVAREGWLAALGGIDLAREAVEQGYSHLVARGEKVRRERGDAATAVLETPVAELRSVTHRVGEKVEAAWTEVLGRLNLPSRQEIRELSRRIDALNARLG